MRLLFLSVFVFLATGCVTSEQFKAGAAAVGPRIANYAQTYAAGDATKLAQAAQLKADTSVLSAISRPAVTTDWAAIKPWYVVGAGAEKDANEKLVRGALGDSLDKLIADDNSRLFKWFGK